MNVNNFKPGVARPCHYEAFLMRWPALEGTFQFPSQPA
jgi:hypothetical protein